MRNNEKRAVLIGHNWNSILGIARALGKKGYEVGAIRTGIKHKGNPLNRIGTTPEAKSRYIKKYILADSLEPDDIVHILVSEFGNTETKAVLFPVDDVSAIIIDENMNSLKQYFFMPNVNDTQGGVYRLMDKQLQKELAASSGLKVAEGWKITVENSNYSIPGKISYPCYAKADIPFHGRKSVMKKCESREELDLLLSNIANQHDKCVMLVEKYIPVEKEYCVVGLCDKMRVCIPDIIDEVVLGHGVQAGVTGYGRVLDPVRIPELKAKLTLFLTKLDFQGLFTIDILESEGEYYFCELNLRIGGSGIAVLAAGCDLVGKMAEILSGNHPELVDEKCEEISFVSERPLLNDYAMGIISWKQYKSFLNQADFRFVYDINDRKPYNNYKIFVLRQIIKRMMRRQR